MEAVAWRFKLILSTEQGKYFLPQLLFSTAGIVVAEQHCGLNWSVSSKVADSVFNAAILLILSTLSTMA